METQVQSSIQSLARTSALTHLKLATLILCGALMLAGCGGGDSGSGNSGSNSSNTPAPNNPDPAPAPDTTTGSTALSLCGNSTTVQQLVDKINAVRSQGRSCGSTFYPAVGALSWNTRLANAAQGHSTDMANNNYFAHEGLNGSTIGTRASAAGYNYRIVGENIAAGYNSIDEVITAWINSPGHCANMMNASFKEYGMACASNPNSTSKTYWTQEFGATN
ncbi:CAP domain-containing protein [Alkanindiges illinoisensis]|uniref:CAP domain-containing protein n=1 Tax=Alkanindiges illinoisensis TaxID=197183 RepID=UPI00146FB092|nr:CAP domain-containing protein [Alkanindiges illinoisensis]